jgi:hypothetical protein
MNSGYRAALLLFLLLLSPALGGHAGGMEGLPHLSLSPPGYDFGVLSVPIASETHLFTISNSGTADLVVSAIAVSDTANYTLDMEAGPAPCGSQTPRIAPGGECTFAVTFSPGSEGVLDTEVTVFSNDPDNPRLAVPLAGFGIICHC